MSKQYRIVVKHSDGGVYFGPIFSANLVGCADAQAQMIRHYAPQEATVELYHLSDGLGDKILAKEVVYAQGMNR